MLHVCTVVAVVVAVNIPFRCCLFFCCQAVSFCIGCLLKYARILFNAILARHILFPFPLTISTALTFAPHLTLG